MNIIQVLTTGQVGEKFIHNNQAYRMVNVSGNKVLQNESNGSYLPIGSSVVEGWAVAPATLPSDVLESLVRAWNRSMPNEGRGQDASVLAPTSARFKRFIDAVTPDLLAALGADEYDGDFDDDEF